MAQIESTPRRVVEIQSESENGLRVKIRNLYEPLFVGLHKIAYDKVELYTSDLSHDAVTLASAKAGDKFLWGWRETGTTMFNIRTVPMIHVPTHLQTCPVNNWYLIEVSKVRNGGFADGYITWTNSTEQEHLYRVLIDNLDV
jgi:hypothetical protein